MHSFTRKRCLRSPIGQKVDCESSLPPGTYTNLTKRENSDLKIYESVTKPNWRENTIARFFWSFLFFFLLTYTLSFPLTLLNLSLNPGVLLPRKSTRGAFLGLVPLTVCQTETLEMDVLTWYVNMDFCRRVPVRAYVSNFALTFHVSKAFYSTHGPIENRFFHCTRAIQLNASYIRKRPPRSDPHSREISRMVFTWGRLVSLCLL